MTASDDTSRYKILASRGPSTHETLPCRGWPCGGAAADAQLAHHCPKLGGIGNDACGAYFPNPVGRTAPEPMDKVLLSDQSESMDGGWLDLLTAALGGGLTVKLLDIGYQEIRRRSESSQSARRFVDEHLAPLLKAADELGGKLRSLADEDFKSLHNVNLHVGRIENHDFGSLLFLLAKLWANIEIIRHEGLSVSIVKDVRGRRLQSFMDCIESRKVRIVDRISQRAIGELILVDRNGTLETIRFIDFIKLIESDTEAQRWLAPVVRILSRTLHTTERQQILQYGIVIHALIDTLDPDHQVTRKRPSYPKKLSKITRRDLKYRVFGQYLKFVPDPGKYLGPPKGRP